VLGLSPVSAASDAAVFEPVNVPMRSTRQLVQPSARPMLAANLASFLNYASLAVVGQAGAGTSECNGGQADRENCRGVRPYTPTRQPGAMSTNRL
jgi:hypothetical protein